MRAAFLAFTLAALQLQRAHALDNGLAITPPMGWRSWNCYHGDVNEDNIRATVDAITSTSRKVDGAPTSLLDLGFEHVGVDDGWQSCAMGRELDNHTSFHAADGTPLVNHTKFKDVKALVDYGHKKKVLMGWYDNNCMCMDEYTKRSDPVWRQKCNNGDIQLLLDAGFDSVKIDNCGDDSGADFASRMKILNASGKALLVENSNQGFGNPNRNGPRGPCDVKKTNGGMVCPGPGMRGNPNNTIAPGWCNFNLFRTGGDIGPDFGGVMNKVMQTLPYQDLKDPIARPGCWAYPDMLEVGNFQGANNLTESKSHFGAWCIVSSPLVLGLDITDKAKVDSVWSTISNKEAIAVNQAWAGHPGRLVSSGGTSLSATRRAGRGAAPVFVSGSTAKWQIWAKPMPAGGQAVFVVNLSGGPVDVTVSLESVGLKGAVKARDIWAKKDIGTVTGKWNIKALAVHDSMFVRFSTA